MNLNFVQRIQLNRTKIGVGLCIGALALTACESSTPESADKTVATEYRKFENQPSDLDVPDVELHEDVLTGLDDHYFRHLGAHEPIDFYMARTNHDGTTTQGLCFIAVNNNQRHPAETICSIPDELEDMVLQLDIGALGGPNEAFLVPDETKLDLPHGWERIRDNVVIITDPQDAPQEVDGQLPGTNDWEDFTLQRHSV